MSAALPNAHGRVLAIGLSVLGLMCWAYWHATPAVKIPATQPSPSIPLPAPQLMRVEPMLPPPPKPTPSVTEATPPLRIDAGQALLAGEALLKDGNTPKLIGHLDLPFEDYLQAMQGMGGRLAGYNIASQQLAGYFQGGKLIREPVAGKFSSQVRDVTDDIPATLRTQYLTQLRDAAGPGSYRLMLVLPTGVQARFLGTIALMAKNAGIDPAEMTLVEYRYSKQGSNLILRLESILHGDTTSKIGEAAVFGQIKVKGQLAVAQ